PWDGATDRWLLSEPGQENLRRELGHARGGKGFLARLALNGKPARLVPKVDAIPHTLKPAAAWVPTLAPAPLLLASTLWRFIEWRLLIKAWLLMVSVRLCCGAAL